MLSKSIPVFLALAFSTAAVAQQSAHVHGFASVNLAIDGGELEIEFASPAESIVGFEYAPSTAAERQAVTDAIALLRNPASLFVLPASAGCELHEAAAERHAEGDHEAHAKRDDHGEHEHANHDGHGDDHAKHDEHGDEHAHEDSGEGEAHAEFRAHYHFDCESATIETIELRLFETWPRIRAVRVQALTPRGQTGANLDADDPVIRLQ